MFEEMSKRTYAMEDSSKATWRGFEDWVETLSKGLQILEMFSDFENRFRRLFECDQAVLVEDKVVMFLCVVDVRDPHDLRRLLEDVITERGLTGD
jgi:hypothetical protein